MRFIDLQGNNPVLINVENIAAVEKTEDGCRIYLVGVKGCIITGTKYEDIVKIIEGI